MKTELKNIEILERALYREKAARKMAEALLEQKSSELYHISQELIITNSKLEELLRAKTSELEGVFENITDAYMIMDLTGNVLKMNKAAIELIGYDIERENFHLLEILDPDYLDYTLTAFKELYRDGAYSNYSVMIKTKNKKVKRVLVNASLIYDKLGQPIGAQGVIRDITAEIQLKNKLQEQKDQLDIIINSSPTGIALSKNKGQGAIMANDAFCNMLGYTSTELKHMSIVDIVHPSDIEAPGNALNRMHDGEMDSCLFEIRMITKQGEILWTKTAIAVVRDTMGQIKYEVGTFENITKEKKANDRIKQSENRLSSLVRNLKAGILLEDENCKVLLTNKMFCDMFGIAADPEQLIGTDCSNAAKKIKQLFKNPKKFENGIKELLCQNTAVFNEELELQDGRYFERSYTPIFDGEVCTGRLWSYEDISSKKNFEKNLQEQKEKYSTVIANTNLGWVETDTEGIIVTANNSFCDFSEYSLNELIGKSAVDLLLAPASQHRSTEYRNKDFKGVFESHEVQIQTKSGGITHVLASGTRVFDVNGKVTGTIGIHLNITEQKNLEIQKEKLLKHLESQNEQLNEYAHIVSHDLKSPLRSISALLSWTKEDFSDEIGIEGLSNLSLIEDKVEKMDLLIENILKYSSIENSNTNCEVIDLNSLVQDILGMIFVPDNVSVNFLNNLPVIEADATKIQQLFQNLLSNAVNHMNKPKGKIDIDYMDKGTHHQFSITDNGIGIEEENYHKIFKIFKSLSDNEKSTGIGLSIVKKVLDIYNGDIWLESEVGEGTRFYFTLEK